MCTIVFICTIAYDVQCATKINDEMRNSTEENP